jgi:hypothetical protein
MMLITSIMANRWPYLKGKRAINSPLEIGQSKWGPAIEDGRVSNRLRIAEASFEVNNTYTV